MSNTETSSFQFVVGGGNRAHPAEVGDDGAGPERGDFTSGLVLIPTMAATGLPNGVGHAAVDFFYKGLLNFGADFEDALFLALHQLQAIHGVAHLGFDHQDDGIVTKAGVGTEKHEEIGKAADG